jgi:hypothetical protein
VTRKRTAVSLPVTQDHEQVASRIGGKILAAVGKVPTSSERKSRDPAEAARKTANTAARNAAAAAGTLALPPGPLGWLTILPELIAVWKIQAQMVADIAAFYGRKRVLTQEQMLYCLFKHTASQAVRDLVVRVGERAIVRRATVRALNSVAQRVGLTVTQRTLAKSASRWLPVVGALGVAAYAYYDTAQVARTAIDLYEREIEIDPIREDG